MAIPIEQVKELREQTGAGVLDCRKALEQANGDFDKAVAYLREKGLAKAAKRAERETSEGMIELYSHGNGRVGVMVEVNCETDFVARSQAFRTLAHEIALQIAAGSPLYVRPEDVPAEIKEQQRQQALVQAQGKPEKVVEKIIQGRLDKFYNEVCLLRQPYIRDENITIELLISQSIGSIGENIVVRRFARWEVGETAEA
ncbi:MAG: translation elongation factor Ts [Omnitrophica WOR_2 bacterium]